MTSFLTRTRGRGRLDWTDWFTYLYLLLGLFLMFGPVAWLVLSSFKTESAIAEFPPRLLPMGQKQVVVPGEEKPKPVFRVKLPDGSVKELAEVRRIGLTSTMVDPAKPDDLIRVPIDARTPVREFKLATENYTDLAAKFDFGQYLWNSVFITIVATIITLLFNSMAAFALSKYKFSGRKVVFLLILSTLMVPPTIVLVPNFLVVSELGLLNSLFITIVATIITLLFNSMAAFALSKYHFSGRKVVFLLILSTLMVPPTIVLVPNFLVVSELGLLNSLWGVIWPAVATPTGVFLLRQYMLTLPDELLEAARLDHASEWRIYWRIVLPLTAPALAVLAIFSVMWRWNDFLWPLVVLTKSEKFTLQLALNAFQGDLVTQWNYLLAMTVITLLPVTVVFAFLQKFITQGIASAGVK